jgi:hypothetical protein
VRGKGVGRLRDWGFWRAGRGGSKLLWYTMRLFSSSVLEMCVTTSSKAVVGLIHPPGLPVLTVLAVWLAVCCCVNADAAY